MKLQRFPAAYFITIILIIFSMHDIAAAASRPRTVVFTLVKCIRADVTLSGCGPLLYRGAITIRSERTHRKWKRYVNSRGQITISLPSRILYDLKPAYGTFCAGGVGCWIDTNLYYGDRSVYVRRGSGSQRITVHLSERNVV